MTDNLQDPELQELDKELADDINHSNRRFLIGLAVGGLFGLMLPVIDFIIQDFFQDLGPLNIIIFAIIGGIWGFFTKTKTKRK